MLVHSINKSVGMTNKELAVILKPEGSFELDWRETDDQLEAAFLTFQEDLYIRYLDNSDKALLYLGFSERSLSTSDSLRYMQLVAALYVSKLSTHPDLEWLREKAVVELEEDVVRELLQRVPFMSGDEHFNRLWIEQAWANLHGTFCDMLRSYNGTVEQLVTSLNPHVHLAGRVIFHLVESNKDEYPFAFLATYAVENSLEGKSKHLPLKNALVEYGSQSRKLLELLSTVSRASEQSEFISELVESGEIFHPIGLTSAEAYTFLKELGIYEEAGIVCRIPKWWKSKSNSLKLSVSVGNRTPSRLNLDALVDFDASLFLAGDAITADELRSLLSEAEGLAFIKGKWVEVNHERLKQTLRAYEQAQSLMGNTDFSMVDALRFQLNAERILNTSEEACELEVTNGQWLQSVVKKLTHPDDIEPMTSGENFHASLRAYQEQGLNWLHYMKSLGLGACLADDMGLGKTIQVIALLNHIRTKQQEKSLLVVPASLIGNWVGEISKFAPSLRYYVIHPSENKEVVSTDGDGMADHDLFITTYGMLLKYDWIKDTLWDSLILDEAQAIKNPASKQTKMVKQLKASFRIAMTGTPIENRLSDLWSLFDFLNKGLLGSAKEFTHFTKQLKDNQDGYAKLKLVVSPFVLRRLKTDKAVITDLPEKIEMKTYATLSKKQVILYNKLVNELKSKLESTEEGIQRKGLVLASLMKFKQICNHPDQYLGQNGYNEDESGKLARLREICETIYEKRERVLIFTQFKEITEHLNDFLEKVFQHKGLVLHGGTAVHRRQELVAKFQGQEYVPFMVLSIKAGGVGLNLTKANHVIHYDRWWNPAVENQATDRAFRIGQKNNVIVHKFITKGTIEEKIDLIIEDKNKLSQEIIPEKQEGWITEMNNDQLMGLFRLS